MINTLIAAPFYAIGLFVGICLFVYGAWKFRRLLKECKANRERNQALIDSEPPSDHLNGCFAKTKNGSAIWISSADKK